MTPAAMRSLCLCPTRLGQRNQAALEVAAAELAQPGIRIQRVLTDNGTNYSQFDARYDKKAIRGQRHKRTRPYRPQTNGKAERFIRTLLDEWAYARPYGTNRHAASTPGLDSTIASTHRRSPDVHPQQVNNAWVTLAD